MLRFDFSDQDSNCSTQRPSFKPPKPVSVQYRIRANHVTRRDRKRRFQPTSSPGGDLSDGSQLRRRASGWYLYGPTVIIAELVRHSDQVCERVSFHFSHNWSAM